MKTLEELFADLDILDAELSSAIMSGLSTRQQEKIKMFRETLMLKIKVLSNCRFTGGM